MPDLTKDDVHQIVREETANLATKDELRQAVAPLATHAELEGVAQHVARLDTRLDDVEHSLTQKIDGVRADLSENTQKIDTMLGKMDTFIVRIEKEEQERLFADAQLDRRTVRLEQGNPAK